MGAFIQIPHKSMESRALKTDQSFITGRELRVCWSGALSLTRGRVCRLHLMLALSRTVILESKSRRTWDYILLSLPFSSLPTTHRVTVKVFDPPPDVWKCLSLSHIATDGQSVCLSWYRAPSGAHDQILVTFWQFLFCPWGGRPLCRVGGSVFCQSLSAVISQLSVCTVIYI
jgi:hypothetical protein